MRSTLLDDVTRFILLAPEMDDERARRAYVTQALYGLPLLENIVWSGAARPFAIHLALILLNYGDVENSVSALEWFLEQWKAHVGGNWQSEIDAFLRTYQTARTRQAEPRKTTITSRNRKILAKKVREFWIEGYLNKSMIDDVWLDLPVEQRPEAVEPIIARELVDGTSDPLLLTPNTSIGALFRATERSLLILGAPGSGKTITLLELAKDLLDEAERDPRKPIPVVLNLASWAEKQPERLEDWLIERLDRDYGVSRKTGERWISDGEMLFLLDGLDEVANAHREACVTALNAYWKRAQVLGENGIAVCSRISEYEILSTRLNVQKAVQLQPLTPEQAQTYLGSLGIAWDGLREAIAKDAVLGALADSPLLLNMMGVAYRDTPISSIVGFADAAGQRKHLFDHYVAQRLSDEGLHPKYTRKQTRHYLAWMARGSRAQNQTMFHIEDFKLAWLNQNQRRRVNRYGWAVRWIFKLGFGLICGPLGIPIGGPFGGLLFGLFIVLAVREGNVSPQLEEPRYTERVSIAWENLVWGIPIGLVFGTFISLFLGLIFGLVGKLDLGLISGLVIGLGLGLVIGLFAGVTSQKLELRSLPSESIWRSLQTGLAVGILSGLIAGLFISLLSGLIGGLVFGLYLGLSSALYYGLASVIAHAILRLVLHRTGDAPLNYAEFLKYTTSRHLTRQIGGGFMFRHRLLMEHFAESGW